MGALVVAVLVVLIGSALCSGSEAALLSVPYVRARQLAESGSKRGRALLAIKQDIARPIAAIVVLNNIFNIVGSIAVGVVAAAEFGEAAVGIVSGVLTFLVILFSEIMPKTLAERNAEIVSLWIAVPIRAVTTLLTPVVVVFEVLMRPLTRGERPPATNKAEIRMLADIGRSEGIIEEHEVELIQRVFKLEDSAACDIMTPRTAVTWVDADRTLTEIRDEVLASPHSRIVVAERDLDQLVGVVLKHDLLVAMIDHIEGPVRDITRPVDVVPWMLPADDLLRQFLTSREHLAMVIDEYGGVMGVVTLEDVIEVLTGPIVDETDERADLRGYARARANTRVSRNVRNPRVARRIRAGRPV